MLRVLLVVVTLGMKVGACSACATRTPTPSPSPASSPGSTFPLEDLEQVSDALNTFAVEHGWAAGCLWAAGSTSTKNPRAWFADSLRVRPNAVAVLDIDHFKLINDAHGHPVGDQILIRVSDAIDHALPDVASLDWEAKSSV